MLQTYCTLPSCALPFHFPMQCERVLSFLWKLYWKERHSLSHGTLERLLQLRCDENYDEENYEHAIELFLHE